ncbi:alpha/beta hydrolase [Bradyrhizobium sp. CCBAU 53338]|uniref:alpha/beta hydrolase n=1 Tax=Bradyrhizobium sp. CCBAU 53338 TaxID=1325111 RepID=UPI00188C325A|nr:alpha/beta hydrolase [Bradyrhizobium sp. CCBAU 53338]
MASNGAMITPETYSVDGILVERYCAEPGSGSPRRKIVCVHGGTQASWAWQDCAPAFAAAGLDVHALNWLGRNGSAPLEHDQLLRMSIADVVQDIRKVTQRFDAPPLLVGHSMGGLACQLYAQTYETKALLLLAPVVTRETNSDPIEMPISMDSLFSPPPREMAYTMFFQALDPARSKHYYDLLVPESPVRCYEATRFTLSVNPARINVPVQIVSGALDILTPAPTGEALAKLYNAEYRVEPELGHNLTLGDKAKCLAESLAPWLNQHA